MKRLIVCIILLVSLCAFAAAEGQPKPGKLLLMTVYSNFAWGKPQFSFGALDENGQLWALPAGTAGASADDPAGLARGLTQGGLLTPAGSVSAAELADLKSLIITAAEQEVILSPAANDAGTQRSYALKENVKGSGEYLLLGSSGDELYENTDPAAQALYGFLRKAFPNVRAFEGETGMAPRGFEEKGLLAFCGYEGLDLSGASLTASWKDCETGPQEREPDRTKESLAKLIVTGKKNSLSVTGGTIRYTLTDAEGKTLAVFEFFGDLLVRPDGMYTVR